MKELDASKGDILNFTEGSINVTDKDSTPKAKKKLKKKKERKNFIN